MMAWINCINAGGGWANIWHLSPQNKNVPRNPSLYLNMGGRYLHFCTTNKSMTNTNMTWNSKSLVDLATWYHVS